MQSFPRHARRTLPSRLSPPAVAGLLMIIALVSGCGTVPPDDPAGPAAPAGTFSAEPEDPAATDMGDQCEYVQSGQAARPVELPPMSGVKKTGTVTFTVTTNQGEVVLTMDRAKTPCTVNSFESLVAQGFYDDTRCHRLADNGLYMLQCGDPTATGRGGPGYTIPDEVTGNEVYAAGSVAMANTGEPNSGGSQFFLVYADSDLPPDYTIFATMDRTGLGVVNRIAAEGQDGSNPDGTGVPNNAAEITTITERD